MSIRQSIDDFLSANEIAIAGVSRNKQHFGYHVFSELLAKGYTLYPVNPHAESIDDRKCYNHVYDLPSHLTHLYIVAPAGSTGQIMKDAISRGFKHIWIQQKSDTPEAIEMARQNEISLVYGECIMMHAEPVKSYHKFHRRLRKFFGGLPK